MVTRDITSDVQKNFIADPGSTPFDLKCKSTNFQGGFQGENFFFWPIV